MMGRSGGRMLLSCGFEVELCFEVLVMSNCHSFIINNNDLCIWYGYVFVFDLSISACIGVLRSERNRSGFV